MATKAELKLTKEVKAALKKLRELPKELQVKERKKILRKATKPLVNAAKNNIKNTNKPVHRYSTGKVDNSIKAPAGKGTIIATYLPGNLKKSIKILTFKKSASVFVGPKLAKRNYKGTFGGDDSKVDGWYAHFLEFGTVHFSDHDSKGFMRNAVDTTKEQVKRLIIKGVTAKINSFKKKNKV